MYPWGAEAAQGNAGFHTVYKDEKTKSHMPVSCLPLLIFSASMIQSINKIITNSIFKNTVVFSSKNNMCSCIRLEPMGMYKKKMNFTCNPTTHR